MKTWFVRGWPRRFSRGYHFDERMKRLQRAKSVESGVYARASYIHDEFSLRLAERIKDLLTMPEKPLLIGKFGNDAMKLIYSITQPNLLDHIDTLIDADNSAEPNVKMESRDIVLSSMDIHWANDPAGTVQNLNIFTYVPAYCNRVSAYLKNGAPFMGTLLGGSTLQELRASLQIAQGEIESGWSPRISPMMSVQTVAALLNNTGFRCVTIDTDELHVGYPNAWSLMKDLGYMGESNAVISRKPYLRRDVIKRAEQLYKGYNLHWVEAIKFIVFALMGAGNILQLIDERQTFHTNEFGTFLITHNATGKEHFRVISILGPQSSGKSALLNGLFETKFQVMQESSRQQTTHGIWAAVSPENRIIVLDVEGTDGRERGEDQDFERKSALFSLALSDLLIVNLWENSVGLYHGSNMNLLKTVLDAHLQLTSSNSSRDGGKSTILFVIRDYVGRTPQENLAGILANDLRKIWDSLRRPDHAQEKKLEDMFDLEFAFLPHKYLMSRGFLAALDELRERILDQSAGAHARNEPSHKSVPIDDLAIYAESLWEQIMENKDLDLPTQQELLAQFRCDEVATTTFADFVKSCAPLKIQLSQGDLCSPFGPVLAQAAMSCEETFIRGTERYVKSVTSKKLAELVLKMRDISAELCSRQLELAIEKGKDIFYQSLVPSFPLMREDLIWQSHKKITKMTVSSAEKNSLEFFNSVFADCQIMMGIDELGDFKIRFDRTIQDGVVHVKKKEAASRFGSFSEKSLRALRNKLTSVPSSRDDEPYFQIFWDNMLTYDEKIIALSDELSQDLSLSAAELSDTALKTRIDLWKRAKEILGDDLSESSVLEKSIRIFEIYFSYGSDGFPRLWDDRDAIDSAFKEASDQALSYLEDLAFSEIPEWASPQYFTAQENSEGGLAFIKNQSLEKLRIRALKEFEKRFVDTKRAVLSTKTSIPTWIYVLLVILGWNEFMAILSTPAYLIGAVFFAFVYWVVRLFGVMPIILRTFGKGMATANTDGPLTHMKSD